MQRRGLHSSLCLSSPAPVAEDLAAPSLPVMSPTTMRSLSSTFRHGLTAFEICAGGGGQVAGLAKAGFRHVALVERDPSACRTLRAAFEPDHVVERDIVGYELADVGPVDLMAGGVPCQPYKSGPAKSANDERDLFPEALRLVERLAPRAVMLENVIGVRQIVHEAMPWNLVARHRPTAEEGEQREMGINQAGGPKTIDIPFDALRAASDLQTDVGLAS